MIHTQPPFFDFSATEAIIFDVDGTLYDQRKLRLRMCMSLAKALWRDPHCLRICKILRTFRHYREGLGFTDARTSLEMQYEVVAERTRQHRAFVEDVVNYWMFKRPLKHLGRCLYDGIDELFKAIAGQGLKTGVFSDYPAGEKLSAMGLAVNVSICSTDSEVRRLKPHPKGLLLCCERLKVAPHKALYIGDRDTLDGDCARRANVPCLILPNHKNNAGEFYRGLTDQLHALGRTAQQAG